MALYYSRTSATNARPPYENPYRFRGGAPALANRAHRVMRAQDGIIDINRRVIARASMPDDGVFVATTDGATGNVDVGDERHLLRTRWMLTPGCMPMVSVLAVPSGRVEVATPTFTSQGSVRIAATYHYDSSNSTSNSSNITLPSSTNGTGTDFAEEPDADGALFRAARRFQIGPILPEALNTDELIRRYCRACVVELDAYEVEGARVLDIVVFEVPYRFAAEADDTGYWASHCASPVQPSFPVERRDAAGSDGDPRMGTHMLADVNKQQRQLCGPMLCSWSNMESPLTTTSTTWVHALTASGTYSANSPGFTANSCGYARDFLHNNEFVLANSRATIPVKLSVYKTTTDDGWVRMQTSYYSSVDMRCDGGVGWYSGYGHIEVGVNPEQDQVIQPWLMADSTETLSVGAIVLEHMGGYTPQAI